MEGLKKESRKELGKFKKKKCKQHGKTKDGWLKKDQ